MGITQTSLDELKAAYIPNIWPLGANHGSARST
jgi:hypothetical protein